MQFLITKRAKALHFLADAENEAHGDESPIETIQVIRSDVNIECTGDDIATFYTGQSEYNWRTMFQLLKSNAGKDHVLVASFHEFLKATDAIYKEEPQPQHSLHCPFCGGDILSHCTEWAANTLEPRDHLNTATLDEWQCRDGSCARSFWI
jgi:hypothetical protein